MSPLLTSHSCWSVTRIVSEGYEYIKYSKLDVEGIRWAKCQCIRATRWDNNKGPEWQARHWSRGPKYSGNRTALSRIMIKWVPTWVWRSWNVNVPQHSIFETKAMIESGSGAGGRSSELGLVGIRLHAAGAPVPSTSRANEPGCALDGVYFWALPNLVEFWLQPRSSMTAC